MLGTPTGVPEALLTGSACPARDLRNNAGGPFAARWLEGRAPLSRPGPAVHLRSDQAIAGPAASVSGGEPVGPHDSPCALFCRHIRGKRPRGSGSRRRMCLLIRLIRQKVARVRHLDAPSQTAEGECRFDAQAAPGRTPCLRLSPTASQRVGVIARSADEVQTRDYRSHQTPLRAGTRRCEPAGRPIEPQPCGGDENCCPWTKFMLQKHGADGTSRHPRTGFG